MYAQFVLHHQSPRMGGYSGRKVVIRVSAVGTAIGEGYQLGKVVIRNGISFKIIMTIGKG